MSQNYYVFYPPSSLPRNLLLKQILPETRLLPAKMLPVCYELKYHADLTTYRYSFNDLQFEVIEDALIKTENWQGVSFEFKLFPGELSIIFWNDKNPNQTTIVIGENSTLFFEQYENEQNRKLFQKFMMRIAENIDAHFCFLLKEPPLKTIHNQGILEYLNSERFQCGELVPIFLAIHDQLLSPEMVDRIVPDTCSSYIQGHYTIIIDKNYGLGPPE